MTEESSVAAIPPETAPAESAIPELACNRRRRELLKKVGKFGLYTAPAILVLFSSNERAYASS